jgi:hypothetical protein
MDHHEEVKRMEFKRERRELFLPNNIGMFEFFQKRDFTNGGARNALNTEV